MKKSWREEWSDYAGRVMAADSYGAIYLPDAWAKEEAFWLSDLTEWESPADPAVGPKTNFPDASGGLCDIAINLLACEPKRIVARKFAEMAVALSEKAIECRAFWDAAPDSRNDPFLLLHGRAKTVRACIYANWLLGKGILAPGSLAAASDDFEASAEGYRKQRKWHEADKVHVLTAIRCALIAGDLERAMASVKIKRPFSGFHKQFEAHARLVKAISASDREGLPTAEIDAFESFFDAVRYPDVAKRNQSERGAKHRAKVLGDEGVFTKHKIVAFELALIKDKYVHGNATPDLDRIIGYITE